jgi:hypothetical protein
VTTPSHSGDLTVGQKSLVVDRHATTLKRGTDSLKPMKQPRVAVTNPARVVSGVAPAARRNDSQGRLAVGGRNAPPLLGRAGVAIRSVGAAVLDPGRRSPGRAAQTPADALLARAGARDGKEAVKRGILSARRIRNDATAASETHVTKRQEGITQIAQIRPDWRPPLQPWSDWEPSTDRFHIALDRSLVSRARLTFETSGLPGPGRRSDGSAEKRKRIA